MLPEVVLRALCSGICTRVYVYDLGLGMKPFRRSLAALGHPLDGRSGRPCSRHWLSQSLGPVERIPRPLEALRHQLPAPPRPSMGVEVHHDPEVESRKSFQRLDQLDRKRGCLADRHRGYQNSFDIGYGHRHSLSDL